MFRARCIEHLFTFKACRKPYMLYKRFFCSNNQLYQRNNFLAEVLQHSFCDFSEQNRILRKFNVSSKHTLAKKIYYCEENDRKSFFSEALFKITFEDSESSSNLYLTNILQTMIYDRNLVKERNELNIINDFEEIFKNNKLVDALLRSTNGKKFYTLFIFCKDASTEFKISIYSRFVNTFDDDELLINAMNCQHKLNYLNGFYKYAPKETKLKLFNLFVAKLDLILNNIPLGRDHRCHSYSIVQNFRKDGWLPREKFDYIHIKFFNSCDYYANMINAHSHNLGDVIRNKFILFDVQHKDYVSKIINHEKTDARVDRFVNLVLNELKISESESEINLLLYFFYQLLKKKNYIMQNTVWSDLESVLKVKEDFVIASARNKKFIEFFISQVPVYRKMLHLHLFRVFFVLLSNNAVETDEISRLVNMIFSVEKSSKVVYHEHYESLISIWHKLPNNMKIRILLDNIFSPESLRLVDNKKQLQDLLESKVSSEIMASDEHGIKLSIYAAKVKKSFERNN